MYPAGSQLKAIIKYAKNLRDTETFGKLDPYVQIVLGSRQARTAEMTDAGVNPVFNQELVLDYQNEPEAEFRVWDGESMGSDEFVGEAKVSIKAVINNGGSWAGDLYLFHSGKKPAGTLNLHIYLLAPPSAAHMMHQPAVPTPAAPSAPHYDAPQRAMSPPSAPVASAPPAGSGYPSMHADGYTMKSGAPDAYTMKHTAEDGYMEHTGPMHKEQPYQAQPYPVQPYQGQPYQGQHYQGQQGQQMYVQQGQYPSIGQPQVVLGQPVMMGQPQVLMGQPMMMGQPQVVIGQPQVVYRPPQGTVIYRPPY